jgi:hypothetical protein
MDEKRTANRILVEESEGKILLGRPKRMWVDNIKMYITEILWVCVDWIDLIQNRDQWRAFVNTMMNFRVP